MNATCYEVERQALEWLSTRGFEIIAPDGLISPAFPDTFVPSAFHTRIVRGASMHSDFSIRQAGCEWVYRHIDQRIVGLSCFHLSSFKMIVFFGIHPPTPRNDSLREEIFDIFFDFLERFGLSPRKCVITYFGGGNFLGQTLSSDETTVKFCQRRGIPEENLVPVRGEQNFTNLRRLGEPAGPRCEIYWPTSSGNFVEIGTVVFEEFLIQDPVTGLSPSKSLVYGAALGIERLTMAMENKDHIFDVPELNELSQTILDEIHSKLGQVCRDTVRQLVDGIRTLTILVNAVGGYGVGKQHDRMATLVKTVRRCLSKLGIQNPQSLVRRVSSLVTLYEGKLRQSVDSEVGRIVFPQSAE